MAHCVSPNDAYSRTFRGLLENVQHSGIGKRQPAKLYRACKDPISRRGKLTRLLPRFENVQEPGVNVQSAFRVDGFNVIHDLPHDAAFYTEPSIEPINVAPLQGKRLRDAKPEANADNRDCAEWLM